MDLISSYSLRLIAEYQNKRPDVWRDFQSIDDSSVLEDLSLDSIENCTFDQSNSDTQGIGFLIDICNSFTIKRLID